GLFGFARSSPPRRRRHTRHSGHGSAIRRCGRRLSVTAWCGRSRTHTAVSLTPEGASRAPDDQERNGAGGHGDVSAYASTPVASGSSDHIVIAFHRGHLPADVIVPVTRSISTRAS